MLSLDAQPHECNVRVRAIKSGLLGAKLEWWPESTLFGDFEGYPYFSSFEDSGKVVWEENQRHWPFIHKIDPPVVCLGASAAAAESGISTNMYMLTPSSQRRVEALATKFVVHAH
jgi:hypothetical protein